MRLLKGVFDGKTIELQKPLPCSHKKKVTVTILEDSSLSQEKLQNQYLHYYHTIDQAEENELSALEEDFSCVDSRAEEILASREND